MTTKEAIRKIVDLGQSLTEKETRLVLSEISSGVATPAQVGGFLTALYMSGKPIGEALSAAEAGRFQIDIPFLERK